MTDKQKAAMQQKYINAIGFGNGKIYVVALADTFSIKDKLKSEGARFSGELRAWYFDYENKNYPLIEMTLDDCLDLSGNYVQWKSDAYDKLQAKMPKPEIKGEYQGEIGHKIMAFNLKLISAKGFDGRFGYTWFYTFEDEKGNQFVWPTSKDIQYNGKELEIGESINYIEGMVKDQKEFRNQKQTYLTRCKIS